jgi:hypothetical protein
VSVAFQMRSPWYERERLTVDLRDPKALRPAIQMYDDTDFAKQIQADPGDSLKFGNDDLWSYPAPVTPGSTAAGRSRFATSVLVYSGLRKLYQPSHSRFYAVVVEVFCDLPGLPRAGSHSDIDVSFVMRRQKTSIHGKPRDVRQMAKTLLKEMVTQQYRDVTVTTPDLDVDELWWATEAERKTVEDDNASVLDRLEIETSEQAWMTSKSSPAAWQTVGTADSGADEQTFPMWRLPPRAGDCDAARTRSLWFGLVPTYSAEHWSDPVTNGIQPKLDNEHIYQLRCIVTQPPERDHEQCPPEKYISEPTRPFRLAAAFDPDGTKNRTISITAPDLRRLAARAGQKQGPGGVRISTPRGSALPPINFTDIPKPGIGKVGGGGTVCTFAFELFFIVALFLFLLFLPIIMLAFQLWWMLALRFCIPPSFKFDALASFAAQANALTNLSAGGSVNADMNNALNELTGVASHVEFPLVPDPIAAKLLLKSGAFTAAADELEQFVVAQSPHDAVRAPLPPAHLVTPLDPLCS